MSAVITNKICPKCKGIIFDLGWGYGCSEMTCNYLEKKQVDDRAADDIDQMFSSLGMGKKSGQED